MASLLGSTLSADEARIEERLRTLALCICASGVIGYGLYSLRSVLVPLVLAVALTYLLQPLIDVLSIRPLPCCGINLCRQPPTRIHSARPYLRPFLDCFCRAKLPRPLAVCVALAIAFGVLGLLGFIVADSIRIFTVRAPVYSDRVQVLTFGVIEYTNKLRTRWMPGSSSAEADAAVAGTPMGTPMGTPSNNATVQFGSEEIERLTSLAGKLPITQLMLHALTSMMDVLSNLALVLLFAVYLLLGSGAKPTAHCMCTRVHSRHVPERVRPTRGSGRTADKSKVAAQSDPARERQRVTALADEQINTYIRGKVAMSLLVGVLTSLSLGVLHVDLWLVFGLLAFCSTSSRT